MKDGFISRVFIAVVLLGGASLHAAGVTPSVASPVAVDSQGWIVQRSDSICGLDDAKMLSNPARVDYAELLAATPEMKKIANDNIDPESSQGIQLRQAACDRVRRACEDVRQAQGHCSIWKAVRHRDGRAVPDVTALVKKKL